MPATKVALVTGSGKRRVGSVVAAALARQGYAVAVHYRTSAQDAQGTVAALRAEGRTPTAFLTEFMARYRQSWAYYEYEIAVFEPGLLPAQRRLLFGGAIRWFQLPLPRAEYQPVALPLTILNEEQKQPGARIR